jgi:D-sedoheptulose 7-phosphate isomerase
MVNITFIENYLRDISSKLHDIKHTDFKKFIFLIKKIKRKNKKIIFIGNGGSASIASHASVDFTKVCNIRSTNFNEANLVTCFSNDYGYSYWVEKALKSYADKDDLIVFISSSGKSKNILNGVKYCIKNKINFVSFTGFSEKSPIKKKSKLNFWVKSNKYNIIEMVHHIWILMAVDYLSKKL